ncbi:MAG: sporulation protein YqfD [Oscillospiraceae bacterium]|nr:sporulation protein YqfD [Oscillospiraceae bacterium]
MATRQIINLIRGSIRLTVLGDFPERFLNLCAQDRVAFWDVDQPDSHTLYVTVAWIHRKGLEDLASRTGCVITQGERRGAPPFLLRFRKRYAFLVGLVLAILTVCVLSRFVLVVEVEGNERVPTQTILAALQRQGLRPGVYGPSLATRDITTQLLLELEDVSWVTVNLYGIRAHVIVRETLESPTMVDESILGDIVAKAPGLVTKIEPWAGDPMVAVGDTVLPGDVLIRGAVEMEPPEYSEFETRWMAVRAMGRVEGRTWRTLEEAIPLTAEVKVYTGEEKNRWSLTLLGKKVNFFQNSGISGGRYDKISKSWSAALPGGLTLPFILSRETCRGYELEERPIDLQAAQVMLEERLLARLTALVEETGTVEDYSFSTRTEGELLVVTLTAECREELGRFAPAPATP